MSRRGRPEAVLVLNEAFRPYVNVRSASSLSARHRHSLHEDYDEPYGCHGHHGQHHPHHMQHHHHGHAHHAHPCHAHACHVVEHVVDGPAFEARLNRYDGYFYITPGRDYVHPWDGNNNNIKGSRATSARRHRSSTPNGGAPRPNSGAPYYVSDTWNAHNRSGSLLSAASTSSCVASDRAEPELDHTSLDVSGEEHHNHDHPTINHAAAASNGNFIQQHQQCAGGAFSDFIGLEGGAGWHDYAVLDEEALDAAANGRGGIGPFGPAHAQRQGCCQCECHLAARRLVPQGRAASSSAGSSSAAEAARARSASAGSAAAAKPGQSRSQTDAESNTLGAAVVAKDNNNHICSNSQQQQKQSVCDAAQPATVRLRPKRRSDGDRVRCNSAMVLDSWLGVSGVPGIGVSVPADARRSSRPQSACEDAAWDKALVEREAKNTGSEGVWGPTSLQSLAQLRRIDLPRINSGGGGNNNGSSNNSSFSSGSDRQRHAALRRISADCAGLPRVAPQPKRSLAMHNSNMPAKNSVGGHHLALAQSKSAHPSNSTTVAQVHWDRGASTRMPWQSDVGYQNARPLRSAKMSLPSPQRSSSFSKRFPRLSAVMSHEGPSSLPDVPASHFRQPLDNQHHQAESAIPRAPIPLPLNRRRSRSSSGSSSIDEAAHYDVIGKQAAGSVSCCSSMSHGSAHAANDDSKRSFSSPLDETFDSAEMSPASVASSEKPRARRRHHSSQEEDYSYVYDCSLSPAFVIRYNEMEDRLLRKGSDTDDVDDDSDDTDQENIYEEIVEVKRRVFPGASSSTSTSSSSQQADSGVHLGVPRKFSSDTLDPVVTGRMSRNVSQDSFALEGETQVISQRRRRDKSHAEKRRLSRTAQSKPLSASKSMPLAPMTEEDFSRMILSHHSRVLNQLRLDQDEFSGSNTIAVTGSGAAASGSDRDSGLSSSDARKSSSSSLSKIKALRFGFVSARSKTSANLSERGSSVRMKRCESMDLRLDSPQSSTSSGHSSSGSPSLTSQLLSSARKYGDAIGRKYFSRLSGNAVSKDTNAKEDFESGSPGQRFQRSRITSQWENLHDQRPV